MIQIYYGDGKGKTSSAVGAAIRASGSGMKVLFTQYFKNGDSGECEILRNISGIDFCVASTQYHLFEKDDTDRQNILKQNYNNLLKDTYLAKAQYDMIVMDEILDAIKYNFVDEKVFSKFLCDNNNTEIIITGHSVSPELISKADYVTEMKMIKHPFNSGVKARKGIEF